MPAQGMQKKYLLTVNSERISDEFVLAKKEGTDEWTRLPVHEGEVAVASRWKEGRNTIYFMIGGDVFSHSWVQERFGAWQRVVDWGLPLLGLVLVAYFALKPGKEAYYEIRAGEIPATIAKEARIGRQELLLCAGKFEDFEGIMKKICKRLGHVSQDSLEAALANLVEEGELVNYRQYFAPAKKCTQKEIVRKGMEEILRDRLMVRGVAMRKGENGFSGGAGSLWLVYCGQSVCMLGSGKIPDAIVFEAREAKEKFEKMLSADGGRAAARLKLAVESKKLALVCIDEV